MLLDQNIDVPLFLWRLSLYIYMWSQDVVEAAEPS